MSGGAQSGHRWVSRKQRPREDRRFITGQGRFAADIARPGLLHAAIVQSPYPRARILSIDTSEAEALPGVVHVLTGDALCAAVNPMHNGVDVPGAPWWPMANGEVRYAGEWVAVVVAESRYLAEDAVELVAVDYDPLEPVVDPEAALAEDSPLVHEAHGSNVLFQRQFVWGSVDEDFAAAPHEESLRVRWHRNSTVPIEAFVVTAEWQAGDDLLDVWASIQMPKYHDQLAQALKLPATGVRVHYDVDVGGSYGVKRGIKHSVVCGWLARHLGRPVRIAEDRLENMSGGDAHGPDRQFDIAYAFDDNGRVRSMRLRALDDCGAYAGRAPLQLGKPVGSIVGPYRIASVAYEAISVTTNKTTQTAVRGFGQSPTSYALEMAMDRTARRLGLDRLEIRRRNLIPAEAFPYTIPSGTEYDSGDYHGLVDKLAAAADYEGLLRRRDDLRARGRLVGLGVATAVDPGGGNSTFEPLFNPKNDTTTWMEGCRLKVDRSGTVTVEISTSTSGQGHQTLAATAVAEVLGRDPDSIRVVHSDSLTMLPGNSPVGNRMAIMLGGAAHGAAGKLKARLLEIGAHVLGGDPAQARYADGAVEMDGERLSWEELCDTAHRRYHLLPPDSEPGLQAQFVYQAPKGGRLPSEDGRVQMYPCFSFEVHFPLVEVDRITGKVTILDYWAGHDCGTIINPDIVRGMTFGGISHGIGVALMERFEYDDQGQLLSGSFVDYVMPSSHEVPAIRLIEQETPSPLTCFGQKGAGEGGYMGAPAAVASAVNDALEPLGAELLALPMRPRDIAAAIAAAEAGG